MKKIVTGCLVLLLILFANNAEARNGMNATRETPLSAADSAQLKRFRDSAFSSALFSARRQAYLDSALMIAPKYAWLWQQKSMPLFKQKKYELGAPFLDSAVKYDAGSWLDYRAFMKCIFQKSYREALTDFYAARALNGNIGVMDHPYDFYIALCHLQLNHFDSARYLLQRLIGAQMQHLGAAWVHPMNWFYLGIANNEIGDYRTADSCFTACLKLYPNFADGKYYLARCLYQTQEWKPALALLLEARDDKAKGYSINEDNIFYEAYPYQMLPYYLEGEIKWVQEQEAKNAAQAK